MAKMNKPLRMGKAITGYKSVGPIKGDNSDYKITTDPGPTEATVTDSEGTVVGTVEGTSLNDIVTKVKEGLVSLGVKFPILQAKDVPFGPGVVTQYVSFDPDVGAIELYYMSGLISIVTEQFPVPNVPFLVFTSAASLQLFVRLAPGFENVVVTELAPRHFKIDNIPADNIVTGTTGTYTKHSPKYTFTKSAPPTSGKFTFISGVDETEELDYDADASTISDALMSIGISATVEIVGLNIEIASHGVPLDPSLLQIGENTLEDGVGPININKDYVDTTESVSVVVS